jgi:hypothetical protein
MAATPKVAALVLAGALAGCSALGSGSGAKPTHTVSAHAVLGGAPPPAVRDVREATFRTPSKNIACALTSKSVRCDIVRKNWQPPPKPADCELDWGSGTFIENGRANFICAGDTVIGAATTTLAYGNALRSGDLMCDSESVALRCLDEKTGHGFSLAVAQYSLF